MSAFLLHLRSQLVGKVRRYLFVLCGRVEVAMCMVLYVASLLSNQFCIAGLFSNRFYIASPDLTSSGCVPTYPCTRVLQMPAGNTRA